MMAWTRVILIHLVIAVSVLPVSPAPLGFSPAVLE